MNAGPALRREGEGARGRLVAQTDDGEARVTWVDEDGDRRVIDHTLVPPAARGSGLAERLAEAAVEAARADGRRVVPACSYVAALFRRRTEWQDMLAG